MVLQVFPHGTICIFFGCINRGKRGRSQVCIKCDGKWEPVFFTDDIYRRVRKVDRTEAVLGGIGNPVVQSHMESSFCFFCSDYN